MCEEIISVVEADDEGAQSALAIRMRGELEDAPLGLKWDITATIKGDAKYWVDRTPKLPLTARQQGLLDTDDLRERSEESWFLSFLFRDIFNPFRPVALSPSWLVPTVTTLARQMYESRDFSLLPILADALQDAGCDHEDILTHCRGNGLHVRGCWVVDLMLGKT
jgi:hypothetical protein